MCCHQVINGGNLVPMTRNLANSELHPWFIRICDRARPVHNSRDDFPDIRGTTREQALGYENEPHDVR